MGTFKAMEGTLGGSEDSSLREMSHSPGPWQPMVTCQPSPYHSRGVGWGEHRVIVNVK